MCFPPLHFCWAIQHKLVWCVWWKTSECSLWFCKDFFDQCLFFFLFSEVQSGMVNRGPVKNRSSTDIICLIIFIAFLVGWGFIGFYGKDTHFKLTYKNVFPPLIIVVVFAFCVSCVLKGRGSDRYFSSCLSGFSLGDPQRLINPTDSNGKKCGVDETVKDKPFLFYFDLTRCADPSVFITGCPTPQVWKTFNIFFLSLICYRFISL